MDTYKIVQGKKLCCGYTTGSCAAAAAKAAARMLFTGMPVAIVRLMTPRGIGLELEPEEVSIGPDRVTCAIRKDSGDDPDITDGMLVFATVEKTGEGIRLCGGPGVGRVTRDGLSCPKGGPAINPTPRRMIEEAVRREAQRAGYTGGLVVTISIPGGETLAARTFNPRLGIEGGLSVLGTSGIVDPMSEQALIDTIHTEMNSRKADGVRHLLAFFGNYGVDFSRDVLHLDVSQRVTCSNYVGELLDYAVYKGFEDVLLIGHTGKLIKLAMGIMNTHSLYADGRMEFMALQAMLCGAGRDTGRRIYECTTTDTAIEILIEAQLLGPVMTAAAGKIQYYMDQRVHGEIRCGAMMFSNRYGVLAQTPRAEELLAFHQKEKAE